MSNKMALRLAWLLAAFIPLAGCDKTESIQSVDRDPKIGGKNSSENEASHLGDPNNVAINVPQPSGIIADVPAVLAPVAVANEPVPVPVPVLPPWGRGGFAGDHDDGHGGGGHDDEDELKESAEPQKDDWPRWGQNHTNNNHNEFSKITKNDATKLAAKCAINYRRGEQTAATAGTSSQPIIVNDVVYWTGLGGQVGASQLVRDHKGEVDFCKDLWFRDVNEVLGLNIFSSVLPSRISPAYYVTPEGEGALLYLGVASPFQFPNPFVGNATPLFAFGLSAKTGKKLFQVEVGMPGTVNPDNRFQASTGSPSIHDGVAYFGISSVENTLGLTDLTFRGQVVALDLYGKGNKGVPYVKWRQFTVPKRPHTWVGSWFAGGGVWGSAPSILPECGKNKKGLVFVGSGNLYDYPNFTASCMTEPVPPQNFNSFVANMRGQTGGGAIECYDRTVAQLKQMGITEPLATNSIIALNIEDGSYAWHFNTQGIDAWQLPCGADSDQPCNVPVPGPDWDTGGGSPVLAKIDNKYRIISHNKGGIVFVLNALTGEKIYDVNLCVGSSFGGVYWGLSYDPDHEQILATCSGGGAAQSVGLDVFYRQVLADGTVTCSTGILNALDVRTGKLKYQVVPAQSAPLPPCPTLDYTPDLRFKSGITYDIVYNNLPVAGVPVNRMPFSPNIPVQVPKQALMESAPSTAGGMTFVGVVDGTVYVLDGKNGTYINQIFCDEGGLYQGISVTSDVVSFGCGYSGFGAALAGTSIMVYSPQK